LAKLRAYKSSQLVDRLNAAIAKGEELTSFEIKGFEREAKALLQTNAVEGYVLLGVLATHQGDEKKMRDEFRRALDLAPNDVVARTNFAIALSKFGYLKDALIAMQQASTIAPGDVEVQRNVVRYACEAGAFTLAQEQNRQLKTKGAEPYSGIDEVVEILREARISDDEVLAVASAAAEVIRNQGLRPADVECNVLCGSVAYRFVVPAEAEDVANANRKIAEALCAKFKDPLDRTIIFACRAL
jgi:tetratricopeptide (TPR) repeat protein